MGTYTTNYNLFLPSIGEQGWGDLVNGNFTTIDTTMKGLSNDIGALDTEINAVEARVTVLETGEFETVNVARTVTADEFVGGVGSFTNLTRTNIEGFNVDATTVNTGISIGSITGEYIYNPPQPFPSPGTEFELVPEFTISFGANSNTQTFNILNIEGASNTNIAMTSYVGAFPATIYVYVNGVKSTLFSTIANGTSTTTRDLEQGAKVKITAVNNWNSSTNVGTRFVFTYGGTAYLK